MKLRNNRQVADIIDHIKDVWQLSIQEEDVLDSLLVLFSAQKIQKIKEIEYLVNDEIDSLLGTLNDKEVIEYCSEELDMISSDDEDDLVKALNNLKYNWIDQVDEDEMINYLEKNGYMVDELIYQNIVEESQFSEWNELFNQLTMQQRDLYINQIRGVYER